VRWALLDWGLSGWLTTLIECFDTDDWVIIPVKTSCPKWPKLYRIHHSQTAFSEVVCPVIQLAIDRQTDGRTSTVSKPCSHFHYLWRVLTVKLAYHLILRIVFVYVRCCSLSTHHVLRSVISASCELCRCQRYLQRQHRHYTISLLSI